jgi:geranylgeranyl reductase family protein
MIINPVYDAIIIGAGPAGSTAAYITASLGLKTLIIDENSFPRDKLCGGLLTWKTIRLLESIFRTDLERLNCENIIQYQSFDYAVCSSRNRSVTGKLDFPFHFVNREKYDQFLLNQAIDAGSHLIAGEKVVAIDCGQGKVKTNRGSTFRGKFILGADGVFSRVRSALTSGGSIDFGWKNGLATAIEIKVSKDKYTHLRGYPSIYWGYNSWGYAWSFPGPADQILGMCALNIKAGKQIRKCFLAFLESQSIMEDEGTRFMSHPLPYGNYLMNPGHGNILLLGDAAGLVDPFLGEGIYYAHKSAQLAATALAGSCNDPHGARQRYTRLLRQLVIPELKYAKIGRQILFSLPRGCYFSVLTFFLRRMPKMCEQTIQGQRSFKWLARVDEDLR